MRKFYIILTGILFTLLFATCTQFTADIDDYLSRWSSEAFIQSSSIDKKTYNDANGMASVASADKVTITLKVQNPKSFRFVMPSASETRKIVEFAHFAGTKPAAGTDYELIQPSADTLKLVYKESFLKKAEWGEEDISSTITLYANDGRPPFKQTFTIPLKANTPPPKPGYAVAKTTGTTAYYVLCITVPDMDKTAGGGGLLHKDLACIEVNGTPYTFSVDEGQHKFTKPESPFFIVQPDPPNPPNIKKLTDPDADNVPTGSWVLFYKTDVEVKDGAAKKDYTIKLIDKKGLASDIVNASTKPNKPETEIVRITKGEKIPGSGSGSSDTDPIIIGTDGDKAEIRIASATANTTVHCTRTDTGTSIPYDGNPVTVPLPLNGGNEKQYKLEYYTDGTGFAATPVKTIYYKVVKAHTVTYRVEIVDEVAGGTIETGSSGQKTSGTVSVAHGNSVTFTGQPTTGDWKVAGWTVSSGFFASPPGTSTTATLSNVTAATTVTVKFYQSTLQNSATWKDLARAVKNAPDNAVIFIDGEIKATSDTGNNGEIVINKNLTIKRATGASSAVIDANKDTGSKPKHRIFKVKSGNTLTLENLTLKGGIAEMSDMDGGGGVYVETSGKLIMTGSSITDCEAIGDTGANKYGEGGGVYNKGTVKMTGGEIRNNKARNGGGIDNNGTLILTNATLTGNTATFIGGALCMSDGSSNEMTGGKIISNTCSGSGDGGGVYIHAGTFTLKSGASIESNTADYGGGAYVGQNGTLIINGGSIKLNKAQSRGGGVYVSGNSAKRGTLRMIQGDISDNGAGWNGTSYTGTGGGVYNNGVFEMTGGEIKDNKAQTGGGVYFSEGTFKMSGSAVVTPATGSEANDKGKNDVYLESGKTITVDGTLTGTAPVARITPELYTEQVVLKAASGSGVTLKNETGKFIVPPQKVTEDSENWNVFWYIADNGNLKAEVEDPDMLKTVIDGSPNNTIIKLGNISDLKTVEIWGYRKIMLKADRAVTLTCSSKGNNYKHLQVQEHASLILKGQITLQGADYGSNSQYALYVENGGKAEIKNGVTITGFKNADRGTVFADGNLTMSGGTITGNTAGRGGGVYIAPSRSFTMTGGSIKGNTAGNGGGVYVDADGSYNMYGNFTMTGGTIEGNTADKGGGVFTYGSFTMSGGTITKNKANTDGKAVMIEHYSTWSGGEIKDNIGTCSVFGPHKSHYLDDTSGNTAS